MTETERADLVATIAEQAAAMSYIVDDYLATARSELGVLTVVSVPVDLAAQVAQVVERMHADEGAPIRVEGTATALGDPGYVRQIIRNLLLNAELRGGSDIFVRLSDHHDPALLSVIDDGPAIPVEDRHLVFKPFEADHRGGGHPDTLGLGLSVARQLARLMDGELSYRFESGHSTFTLSLPAHRGGQEVEQG